MTECLSFVSAYPVDMITPNVQHRIPRGDMYFQHEVTIKVKCYNQPGQTMPEWLKYLAEQFGGKLRFTDVPCGKTLPDGQLRGMVVKKLWKLCDGDWSKS